MRSEFWSGLLSPSWMVNLWGVAKWDERVGEGGIEPASDTVGDDGPFVVVRERRPEAVGESGG